VTIVGGLLRRQGDSADLGKQQAERTSLRFLIVDEDRRERGHFDQFGDNIGPELIPFGKLLLENLNIRLRWLVSNRQIVRI
jgi:hypothetical protein